MVVLQCHVSVLLFPWFHSSSSANHAIVSLRSRHLESTVRSASKLEHIVITRILGRGDVLRLVAALVYRATVRIISLVLAFGAEIGGVLHPRDLGCDPAIITGNLRQSLALSLHLLILRDVLGLGECIWHVLSVVRADIAVTDGVMAKLRTRDHRVTQIVVCTGHVTGVRAISKVVIVILNSQNILLNYAALLCAVRLLAISTNA